MFIPHTYLGFFLFSFRFKKKIKINQLRATTCCAARKTAQKTYYGWFPPFVVPPTTKGENQWWGDHKLDQYLI